MTPIALQRVVDRMSDGYIIVNDENIVTDFNQTFLDLFSLKTGELRNININDLITKLSSDSEKRHTFLDAINKTKSNDKTIKILYLYLIWIEHRFPKTQVEGGGTIFLFLKGCFISQQIFETLYLLDMMVICQLMHLSEMYLKILN